MITINNNNDLSIFVKKSDKKSANVEFFCAGITKGIELSGLVYGNAGSGEYSIRYVYKNKLLPTADINGESLEDDVAEMILNQLMKDNEFVKKCFNYTLEVLDLNSSGNYIVKENGESFFNGLATMQIGGYMAPNLIVGDSPLSLMTVEMTLGELGKALNINKVSKETIEYHMTSNPEEELSDATLITMTLETMCADDLYGSVVNKDEVETYLWKIADTVKTDGSNFYETNIRECEICVDCGKVLLPDDECYESDKAGEPFCDSCFSRDIFEVAQIDISDLPQLATIKSNFLTYVGGWMNGQDCRTGENRENGMVTYCRDGLYLYEFKTREDAFKYFYDNDHLVPFAFAEYDESASDKNEMETFSEWEFNNGFQPLWLDSKLEDFMQKNISSEEEKDALVAEIYSWHKNCEHGQDGECEIFDAIERSAQDDEVILIAFDVDRDLFDKFEKIKLNQPTVL